MYNFSSLLVLYSITLIVTGGIIVFISTIAKMVNNFVILSSEFYNLSKPPVFSSMTLQSGIFTINRNIIIGLVSSIITAAIGYGIRLILLNYFNYDVFTNLNNLLASLSYFCSLGGIRFVISEFIKENTLLMSCCGGPSPVGSNAAGNISFMQPPNNPGIGSSSAGNPGAGGGSITGHRLSLEQRIRKVLDKVDYFSQQLEGAQLDLNGTMSRRRLYLESGREDEWYREYKEAMSAIKDSDTNLASEHRMLNILQKKLANGDYSMSSTSATAKRGFNDSSMSNDNSTPTDTKRTPGDK